MNIRNMEVLLKMIINKLTHV